MTDRTSYPSPNAAATRPGAPFYPNPGALSPSGDVPDLNLHNDQDHDDKVGAALTQHLNEQLAQHLNSNLHTTTDHAQDPNLMHIDTRDGHDAQVMAREVMNLNHDPNGHQMRQDGGSHTPKHIDPATPGAVFSSLKPRTKVSRACDECRRKKVILLNHNQNQN
jgi:hypothetical protein